MFLYLIITRPLKNKLTQIQYVVLEMMFCLVSVCVLILVGLDQANASAFETREALSTTILYSILIFTWAGQVSLIFKTILDIRTFYYEKKSSKQTEIKADNLESKEDQSPLTDGNNIELAKPRTNFIPENQDTGKELISDSSPINSPSSFSESKQLFWKVTRNIPSKEERGATNENNIQIIDLRDNDEEIVGIIGPPSSRTSPVRPKDRSDENEDQKHGPFGIREQKEFDVSPICEKKIIIFS